MVAIPPSSPEQDPSAQNTPSLADLSRNASVISSSSSSSSTSDLTVQTPRHRPRPLRNFSSPGNAARSRSPQSPTTPRGSRPPAYLARELGLAEAEGDLRPPSRPHSTSRSSSASGRASACADDFWFLELLGEGSYSEVVHVRHKATGEEFAIKIINKNHLKKYSKVQTAMAEKNALVKLGAVHPGIVRLHSAFQDQTDLYFVLDLAPNGELQSRISNLGSLSTECTRVYAAQLVDALGYMHSQGVIHRDLKPENLLLDDAFRIKITDFGTGKVLGSGGERAKTFVGTAQYISPELLEDGETSESSDFWALGCIVYQMITGRFAFQGLSEYLTFQKIKQLDYSFPEGFDEQAKDLVQRLLVRDPAKRLGAGPLGSEYDMQALRSHPFFASINWGTLWTDPVPPLEPGLFKKQPKAYSNGSSMDCGTAWDSLVGNQDGTIDEGIPWATDEETSFLFGSGARFTNGNVYSEEEGPMGEQRPYAFPPNLDHNNGDADDTPKFMTRVDKSDTSTVRFTGMPSARTAVSDDDELPTGGHPILDVPGVPSVVKAHPIDVPASKEAVVDSCSTGSATSSSDGSAVEKLGAAMETSGIDRGRSRDQTPLVGNGMLADSDLTSLLLPNETILFNSSVEETGPKRRASRLFAMAVTPRKIKSRELVLTNHRLLCLKHKPGRAYKIRTELHMRPLEKETEKDGRQKLSSVEPKGDREFVVVTICQSL
ncbi:kinase-like protein [Laetiporus sulphureus 93-53]|uniref:non-specific serine/threonine protein kinase n=1 Tax=Laetiporus sulphureus 93-53 TaxID=1314785 RepID=A0A165F5F3_9APHY|nr:kinase-like protein [Laetiporus sulphureus 93-53]KZT08424.1 kinase-like protein [Laetiporus sulphureus 93-53]